MPSQNGKWRQGWKYLDQLRWMINVDSLYRQKSGLVGKDHYTQGVSGQKDNISCQLGD